MSKRGMLFKSPLISVFTRSFYSKSFVIVASLHAVLTWLEIRSQGIDVKLIQVNKLCTGFFRRVLSFPLRILWIVRDSVQQRDCCYVAGRGGTSGGKFRISLGLPVGAVINCADNTGI